MEATSAPGFLDANSTRFALPNVVEDHAPSSPPTEDLLNTDNYRKVAACVLLDFFLPSANFHVFEHSCMDDITRLKSLQLGSSGLSSTIQALDLGSIRVQRVQNSLLDEIFGGTLHEDLCDTQRPLFL